MTSKILEEIERNNRLKNLKGLCPRLLSESLESYKLNKKNKIINDGIIELEKEIKKLRELKEKGQFNLQQSEYSLKRLTEKFLNKLVTK